MVVLVAKAMTNKEIAYRMGISEGTVKQYMSRLMRKLGFTSRVQVVVWYLNVEQEGLG